MKKDHWRMPSNPNYMLLEADEGFILVEEEVDFMVEGTTKLNQSLWRSPSRILLI
jgi:hypothetical protein